MPRSPSARRQQAYSKVLTRLLQQAEFAIEELRESFADEHRCLFDEIVDQLRQSEWLLCFRTETGLHYRWNQDVASISVDSLTVTLLAQPSKSGTSPVRTHTGRLAVGSSPIAVLDPVNVTARRIDPGESQNVEMSASFDGLRVAETAVCDRPRERLMNLGAHQLKTGELLAILIRSGRAGESAMQSGDKIASRLQDRLDQLPGLGIAELKQISKAVNEPAYCQIMAGIELGKRVTSAIGESLRSRIRISSPATAMEYCLNRFSRLAREARQEEFHLVTLDTKNQPIATHQITVGTLRNSLVHPREVFRPAIRDAANCVLVVHNHPSGDPTPSEQDFSVTDRLESAAEIIGIPLIDHIVVAGDRAVSLREWRSGRN